MSTYLTIQATGTYRLSGYTHEKNGYTWRGHLVNAPVLEGLARDSAITGDTIREVAFEIDNATRWFDLVNEKALGAIVTMTIDGYPEAWMGKVNFAKRNIKTGILSLKASEDQEAVLSRNYPHFFLESKDYTNIEAGFVNKPIPTVIGGTVASPIRVPGMVVDRVAFVYLFCVGEIHQVAGINKAGTAITTGFTSYTGTSGQAVLPGFVCMKFDADPRDDAGHWPEVTADIIGLKLGSHTIEECRNPMRFAQYFLTTASSGVNGWGLGYAGGLNTTVINQAIADCDTYAFKIDGIINDSLKARVWFDRILDGCRGSRAFVAGDFELYVDKPGVSVKTFNGLNSAPLDDGPGDSKSRINRVSYEYRYRYGQNSGKFTGRDKRDDLISQADIGLNEKKIQLPLVADHATAGAIADYVLNSAKYEESKLTIDPQRVTGTAAIANKVVTCDFSDFGINSALYRVKRTKIQDRKPILELAGYSDSIFDITAIGTPPADPIKDQALPGTAHILAPDAITAFTLSTSYEKRKDGTIYSWIDGTFTKGRNYLSGQIQISQDAGSTWQNSGVTTSNSFRVGPVNPGHSYKVRVIATGANGQASPVEASNSPITTAGSAGPADVTGFAGIHDTLDLRKVGFTWNPVNDSDLRFYEIRKGSAWNTAPVIGYQIVGTKFETTESANGTYTYLVKAIDTSGNYSANAASYSLSVIIYPSDVTGFVASQRGEKILLSWFPGPDLVLGYEIREGASWELGQTVVDTTTDISALLDANFERAYTFWIKAKSIRRYPSQNAASAGVIVGNLLPKNYVVVKDEIQNPTGTHNQTEIGGPFWTFQNMEGSFADYPNLAFNDFPGENVLKLAKTVSTIPSPLIYNEIASPTGTHSHTEISATQFTFDKRSQTFEGFPGLGFDDLAPETTIKLTNAGGVYDLSGNYTVRYSFAALTSVQVDVDWSFVAVPTGSAATLEIRTSNDGSTWSAWELFTSGRKAGRHFEFRLGLSSSSINETGEVTKFEVTFSPTSGEEVYYSSGFYTVQYDIGSPTTCDIAVDKFLFVMPPGVSATLDFRYSVDGAIWSAWEAFVPTKKTFRYIEFRMNLATDDTSQTPEVTRFSVAIDVPDVDQKGTSVVPLAGQTILFPASYNFAPALVCTAEGSDCIAEYSAVTKDGFFVIVKKISDGTAINGRTINWISKGY